MPSSLCSLLPSLPWESHFTHLGWLCVSLMVKREILQHRGCLLTCLFLALAHIFFFALPHLCIGAHHWGLYFKVRAIHRNVSWLTSRVCAADGNHLTSQNANKWCSENLSLLGLKHHLSHSDYFYLFTHWLSLCSVFHWNIFKQSYPNFSFIGVRRPEKQTLILLQYFLSLHLNTQMMTGEGTG